MSTNAWTMDRSNLSRHPTCSHLDANDDVNASEKNKSSAVCNDMYRYTRTLRLLLRPSLAHMECVSNEDQRRVCSYETRLQREHIFMNFNYLTRE